ncbi:MAG: RluA family pseudouridine synthase [Oscillospiraceae bacterium]|jgi:23S rRNA pseudouridine1911/1915/1917 synthase|nr:RluA family pseudouridine synthase [Oscillospiraceae bacterium]
MRVYSYQIDEYHSGWTVEGFLRSVHYSSRVLTKLKKSPTGLLCNGEHIRTVDKLSTGDVLRLELEDEPGSEPPIDLPVEIVYDDADLLIYDKPAAMPCHPSQRHREDTLANVFAYYCLERKLTIPFRQVNRLDKDTTGLTVIAKNEYVSSLLNGRLEKEYLALTEGKFTQPEGTIDAPIRRLNEISTLRLVAREGEEGAQSAHTRYQAAAWGRVDQELHPGAAESHTLLRVWIATGRTHQIRVHCASIGHPLAGDDLYGGSLALTSQQMLRCYRIRFLHPVKGEWMEFSRPWEKELVRVMEETGIEESVLESLVGEVPQPPGAGQR